MLKPNPRCDSIQCDGILWEEISREGRALMNGISAHMKETPESSLAPSAM